MICTSTSPSENEVKVFKTVDANTLLRLGLESDQDNMLVD